MIALLAVLAPPIWTTDLAPLAVEPVAAEALAPLAFEPLPAAALSVALPVQDGKPTFSYTFVEANYLWTDIDGVDDPLDGWEARASLELPLNFFIQLSYSEISDEFDVNEYYVGAGWHFSLGNTLDLYGILSATGSEIEDSGFDTDEDSIAGEVGARFLLGEKIELNGDLEWNDAHEEDEFSVGAGGRWYFTTQVSAGLNVDFSDETENFAAGLRFQF